MWRFNPHLYYFNTRFFALCSDSTSMWLLNVGTESLGDSWARRTKRIFMISLVRQVPGTRPSSDDGRWRPVSGGIKLPAELHGHKAFLHLTSGTKEFGFWRIEMNRIFVHHTHTSMLVLDFYQVQERARTCAHTGTAAVLLPLLIPFAPHLCWDCHLAVNSGVCAKRQTSRFVEQPLPCNLVI